MERKLPRLTRAEKQAETRALLIEAAAKEFAEHGYAIARIEKIAEAAGFSKGAFYSNFDSKEQLVLAVLDRTIMSRTDLMARAIDVVGHEPADLLAAIKAGAVARQEDRLWSMLRLELLHQAARDSALRSAMTAHCAELLSANAGLIVNVRKRLGLRPQPPAARAIADTLLATMLGASLLLFAGVKVTPVATIMTILLNALVAENPMAPGARPGNAKTRAAGPAEKRRR
jgi:AcrR family transcriptional regulator